MKFFLLMVIVTNELYAGSCVHLNDRFNCVEYVKNYDADTITFNIPGVHSIIGEKINIRVSGVDTPEIRTKNSCEKKLAKFAKKEVEKVLKGAKRIDLANIKRGKYFRIVADVIIDGKSLTEFLIKSKYAYIYDGGKKKSQDWCKRLPASLK